MGFNSGFKGLKGTYNVIVKLDMINVNKPMFYYNNVHYYITTVPK